MQGGEKAPPAVRPLVDETPTGRLPIQVRKVGDTMRILLPFKEETAGAVFQRADTLWLVFDNTTPVDLAGLQAQSAGAFRSVDATRTKQGTAIRIGLDKSTMSSASRDEFAWIITLGQAVLEPPKPVSLQRGMSSEEKAIAIADFDNAGTVHHLTDPLAGDKLIVVTGMGPARSFLRQQDFLEFSALTGSHGLAFKPQVEDLTVDADKGRVVVSRPKGLTLSPTSSTTMQTARAGARRSRATTFDTQVWGFDRDAHYADRESDLIYFAAIAHETQRTAARLDLIRFYMAKQRFVEAKAVLDTILRSDKRTADDGSLQGLRGILNVMIRRPKDAIADLNHPTVSATQDAGLWRSVAQARLGQYPAAHEGFRAHGQLIGSMPEAMQREILLAAAETALEVGDYDAASNRISEIEHIGLPVEMEPMLALLSGRLAEAQGRLDEATSRYSGAGIGPISPAKADADLRLALLRAKQGKLNRDDLIEALVKQSFAWRGDEIEARTMEALGKNLADAQKYREAFNLMRVALKAHPQSNATRSLQDHLMALFEKLYLDGKADEMNPVDALSLFYDFRDLTPPGRKGDEVIRKLADRMVGIDLLDQAAQLLQHQVDNRLTGAAKAQVAARLAVIHLMNRKPQLAINVLRKSRMADLPEQLRQQRYLLEARALADTDRQDLALDMLSEVKSREAEVLRTDILWGAERWLDAAEQSELIVDSRKNNETPLDSDERRIILRSAIGYAMANDLLGLQRLRAKYKPLIDPTEDAKAFDVVTAPVEARGVEYREIAKSLADRDTLDSFLKSYHARYPTEMPGASAKGKDQPRS